MKRFVTIMFLIPFLSCPGQDLTESRQTSYYTYLYKITNEEAREIYRHDIRRAEPSFFHTPVDSFPTDSIYVKRLSRGHYLKTHTAKNKLNIFIASIPDFEVMILNNSTDLCIRVYDTAGQIIPDAELAVRGKHLRFDAKAQSYRDKKSNRKGLLKVSHNGFTGFYELDRKYNNPRIYRIARMGIYGTPVKYAWMPVNFIIHIPIDVVRSAVRGWPQGTIQRTGRFFQNTFDRLACKFDDYYCDRYGNDRFDRNHKGYMVFSKPKYLPGDTVQFKAFVVSKKGKPAGRKADVVLVNNRKRMILTSLAPYRKGGYVYQFPLHDSLNLQLDRDYTVHLEPSRGKAYISGSFRYEDYELSKVQLEIRTDSKKQYRGKEFRLYIKGTDENELNLPDARAEIFIRAQEQDHYFKESVFIPDTLLFTTRKLDGAAETEVVIPDSVFPEVNITYDLQVSMLTSDNDRITKKEKITYFHSVKEIDFKIESDSVLFTFLQNGIMKEKNAVLYGIDNYGNNTRIAAVSLPAKTMLNPYYVKYLIKTDSMTASFPVAKEASLLQCYSERTKDSLHIRVDNPRCIPFTYFIYRKNNEKTRGYADSLAMDKKISTCQNYFLSIQYLWGGKMMEDNYRIPYNDKELNIEMVQPRVVYPGQKTRIEIRVSDQEGRPVPGVDLTVYSLTNKFEYSAPDLPYMGKPRVNKTVINTFGFNPYTVNDHTGLYLDYNTWCLRADLDTIEYYRFIYPGDSIYTYSCKTSDNITQFAPFVVRDGSIQKLHMIYVDGKPVYFSWSTNVQPYSFRITGGYHQIRLRTAENQITIDSLYFPSFQKTIFSLHDSLMHKHVRIENAGRFLTDSERQNLHRYIFPYRNTFGEKYAYIVQGNDVQFLKPSGNRFYDNFAGPVTNSPIQFQLLDGFSLKFDHEPFFEYEFAPELLKMRGVDAKRGYPDWLTYAAPVESLTDKVMTVNKIKEDWANYVSQKRYSNVRYGYPRSTSAGKGRLLVDYVFRDEKRVHLPLNILLFRYDNHEFLRVYPGSNLIFHELDKGYYRLLFFYPGSRYYIKDSLLIRPDGLNYYKIDEPEKTLKDSFSEYVSSIIEETLFKPYPYGQGEEKELKQIYDMYQQQFTYTGDGETVEGYAWDSENNEPIPGVNVIALGTTYGTVTDVNGHYSLKVPRGINRLEFSFIGYLAEEVNIGADNIVNVWLTAEVMHLDEVVVVGYGTTKRSSLTGAVSTVTSKGIPGISSNLSQSLQGQAAGVVIVPADAEPGGGVTIQVRGIGSAKFDRPPLYIIDGNVYAGDIRELRSEFIENIEILRDASATAIYGSRGANGVVIISTKKGSFRPTAGRIIKGAAYSAEFFEAASQSSSIRENFSDCAFWQPELITDSEGKAAFEVIFPGDVTSWKTICLAMNNKKQTGQTEGTIHSYKPVMAQLAVPRFLVRGDTLHAIGKALNYTPDSIKLSVHYEINDIPVRTEDHVCVHSIIDTLVITPVDEDSLQVKYFLKTPDGYFDGERRNIPVFAAGLEEARGDFRVADRDTVFHLAFDKNLGTVQFYMKADVLSIVNDEISRLIHYRYECNEQLASKLKALLAEKRICRYQGENFIRELEIQRMVRLLEKNQNKEGLWGWWKNSGTGYWISQHVLEALLQARHMGYTVSINENLMKESLLWQLSGHANLDDKISMIRMLRMTNARVDYETQITWLERDYRFSRGSGFRIMELRQMCDMKINIDSMLQNKKTTLFGNLYFSDEEDGPNITSNDIQQTLTAYRILKNDSLNRDSLLVKIRNYLFEKRSGGSWTNTYEAAQIVETILPDMLIKKDKFELPVVQLNGAINKTIKEFPFEAILSPGDTLAVSKKGDFPVYLTAYQRYWNNNPEKKTNDFEITARFENADASPVLKSGKEIKYRVDLTLLRDADYLLIEVPMPAGCSYASKENQFYNEVHREYFKN